MNNQNFFVLLHPFFTIYMKFLKKYIGWSLIVLGILLLVTLQLLHLNFINAPLFIALGIIILGLILHVWSQKRESRY